MTDSGQIEAGLLMPSVNDKDQRWRVKTFQRRPMQKTCWGSGVKVWLCWSGNNSSFKKTVPVAKDKMIT